MVLLHLDQTEGCNNTRTTSTPQKRRIHADFHDTGSQQAESMKYAPGNSKTHV